MGGASETKQLSWREDPPPPSWGLRSLLQDSPAVHFGVRMAVCLTVASLFVLCQPPGDMHSFPEGMWVVITVTFICWFPTLDAASVVEKSFQRLCGTLLGAGLALVCGFVSLRVQIAYGVRAQAAFILFSFAVVPFVVGFYAVNTKIGGARFIDKKNYATFLCILTHFICLLPFYKIDEHYTQWEKSMYRVKNVSVGCVLGVTLSVLVFPRPTVKVIQDKLIEQIGLAGEAAEAVLHLAAETFAENAYVPLSLAEEILEDPAELRGSIRKRMKSVARTWRMGRDVNDLGHDMVLETYEAAANVLAATKSQLGLLGYDPFNIGKRNDLLEKFRAEVAQTLARVVRIQMTVVLIDGIIRNEPKHNFSEDQLGLLGDMGLHIRSMLSVPLDTNMGDEAAMKLCAKLVEMRRMIVDLTGTVSSSSESKSASQISIEDCNLEGDDHGEGVPELVRGSHASSLLFLQLCEHLALRSVRLYQSWKQYEGVLESAETMRASVMQAS